MEGSGTLHDRRLRQHAGYALIDVLLELAGSGARAVLRWLAAASAAQARAQARRELQWLSDRSLRDIGLQRSDIERLFR